MFYEIPCRPWGAVGADSFMINGRTLLCTVHYHNKFPIMKKVNSLSADEVVQMAKMIFAKYGLPKKIVLDVSTNCMAETFKAFCRRMNMKQTIKSYHHQSNGQVEACIKFVKCPIKDALKLIDTYI